MGQDDEGDIASKQEAKKLAFYLFWNMRAELSRYISGLGRLRSIQGPGLYKASHQSCPMACLKRLTAYTFFFFLFHCHPLHAQPYACQSALLHAPAPLFPTPIRATSRDWLLGPQGLFLLLLSHAVISLSAANAVTATYCYPRRQVVFCVLPFELLQAQASFWQASVTANMCSLVEFSVF